MREKRIQTRGTSRLGSTDSGSIEPPPTRLLLVEDEFLIRLTLSEALTDAGYDVAEAADADEALRLVDVPNLPVGLLLTDIQLPGPLDGHALAARIRDRLPGLPGIFMTGRPAPPGAGRPRRAVVLAKPYLPSEVCAAVGKMLAA